MKKTSAKTLLRLTLIGMTAVFAGLSGIHAAASSVSTKNNAASFEEFAQGDEDPQAYSEYEKQKQQPPKKQGTYTSLSGANTPFKDGDYAHDSKFADCTVVHGIDVSVYQKTIDWKKAKAGGVDYAIIRVAYRGYGSGALVADTNYKANIEGAIAAGVDVGIYIFSQAITEDEAKEEARYAISLAEGYDLALPVVMDFEYASTSSGTSGRLYDAKLSKEAATKVCNAFCKAAEDLGYTGMVYANKSMLNNQVNAASIADKYPIWLACYPSNASSGSGYLGDYSYWQYSSTGSVPGISGNVDCNFRYMKKPAKPAAIERPDTSYTDNTLSWSKVPGAYGYQLYRRDSADGSFTKIATLKGAGNISYFDYDLTPGTNYAYRVRAYYKLAEGNLNGAYSNTIDGATETLSANNFQSSKQTTSSITLKWKGNADANGYGIFQSTNGKNYTLIAEVDADTLTYKHTNLKPGKKFYYQLRSGVLSSKGTMIYENQKTAPTIYIATKCEAPTNVKASANTAASVKLSWKKVTGASGYQIYAYDKSAGKYKQLAVVKGNSKTSYTVKNLKAATTLQYKVRCYQTLEDKEYYSSYSDIVYTATKPKKISSLTYKSTKNSVTLSWKKSSGASGYIVYLYNTKTKKYTKISTVKTNKYTQKKLSRNASYQYKIVAYKKYKNVEYKASGAVIKTKTKK